MQALGAIVVLALGVFGLFWPQTAARFVQISPVGLTGISEIRATYGGVFLGLGAMALMLNQPAGYQVIGLGFALAALARAASVVSDRSRDRYNLAGIVFEGLIALLLLV